MAIRLHPSSFFANRSTIDLSSPSNHQPTTTSSPASPTNLGPVPNPILRRPSVGGTRSPLLGRLPASVSLLAFSSTSSSTTNNNTQQQQPTSIITSPISNQNNRTHQPQSSTSSSGRAPITTSPLLLDTTSVVPLEAAPSQPTAEYSTNPSSAQRSPSSSPNNRFPISLSGLIHRSRSRPSPTTSRSTTYQSTSNTNTSATNNPGGLRRSSDDHHRTGHQARPPLPQLSQNTTNTPIVGRASFTHHTTPLIGTQALSVEELMQYSLGPESVTTSSVSPPAISSSQHSEQRPAPPPPPVVTSKTSTYFPVLRRMQSRKRDKENAQQQQQLQQASNSSGSSSFAPSSSSHSGLRLPRNRRSLSQPPPIPRLTERLRQYHQNHTTAIDPLPSSQPNSSASPIGNPLNNATVADLTAMPDNTASSPRTSPVSRPDSDSAAQSNLNSSQSLYSIRLVPHLDATRSLHFEPIERKIPCSASLKIGRFTDRGLPSGLNSADQRIAFKSKVVSRGHADIFTDQSGSFFIKDTKSSSGTFLNHVRLSAPGGESKPFPLRDGDVLQLGVDYQGGTEEIYRCVKMRVELNRGWQRSANNFNQQALAQLRSLGAQGSKPLATTTTKAMTNTNQEGEPVKAVSDCCICLFGVTVCQALFIAPCSHTYHYKCIRPLLQMHHPGFSCPLCRTFADLEADVETDEVVLKSPAAESIHTPPKIVSPDPPVNPEGEVLAHQGSSANSAAGPSRHERRVVPRPVRDTILAHMARPDTLFHPLSTSMEIQGTVIGPSASFSPGRCGLLAKKITIIPEEHHADVDFYREDEAMEEVSRVADTTLLDRSTDTSPTRRSPVLLGSSQPSSGMIIERIQEGVEETGHKRGPGSSEENKPDEHALRRSGSIGSMNCSIDSESR